MAMMPSHLRPVLLELETRLALRFAERFSEVRLFGSYARGEANEHSDVDVLVLVDDLASHEIASVSDITFALAIETGIPLASVPMATERFAAGHDPALAGGAFVREVERDGERP